MKRNKKCGPGCNCIHCGNLCVTAEDVDELEIEELTQESQVMDDGHINDSDDDLIEQDEITHFVFGEESDSDCDAQ